MTELEIVLGIACGVLFVAWRHATNTSTKHYEAACMFKTTLKKVADKEVEVFWDSKLEALQVKLKENKTFIL